MAKTSVAEAYAAHGAAELETRLCAYVGAPYCIAVGSAPIGLLTALKAAGIGDGASVLYTGFGDPFTAEIIRLAGGQPVPVDAHPGTYCADPCRLERLLARRARKKRPPPKALIAADVFGLPASYAAIEAICKKYGVTLIEDMGESFGAVSGGRGAGCFGRMAVGSLFPARPSGMLGEGGIIFCHSEGDAARLRSLRRALAPEGSVLGAVQASLAAEKLAVLDLGLARRRAVAARYRERLAGHVKLQDVPDGAESACTRFAVSLPGARQRDAMIERLRLCHIPSDVFEPCAANRQSVAERLLLLPMHPYLSRRVVDYICDRVLDGLSCELPPDLLYS